MYLSVLRYIFKSRSKKGYYDLNKKAEPFFRDILNLIYDWELQNLNQIQSNYSAIDLGDIKNKTCVQVTAENTAKKITHTIKKFEEKKLSSIYDRLIVLIITDKKNYSTEFTTSGKFEFDQDRDIKDIDDILADIEDLQIEKLEKLHDYLKRELSAIVAVTAEPSSLLAKAEKRVNLPPKSGAKFLDYLEYEDSEKKKGLVDLLEFYGRLSSLPKRSREYLHLIIINGTKSSVISGERFTILPRKLENLSNLSDKEVAYEFRILEQAGIASYDDSDRPPFIEVSFFMDTGVELIGALKDFAGTEDDLVKIIVDCDFTILDSI